MARRALGCYQLMVIVQKLGSKFGSVLGSWMVPWRHVSAGWHGSLADRACATAVGAAAAILIGVQEREAVAMRMEREGWS